MHFIHFFLALFLLSCSENQSGEKQKLKNETNESEKDSVNGPKLLELQRNLVAPVFLTHAGDDRLFILEQRGIIRIIKEGKLLENSFLDISSKVEAGKGYSEKGLLGLAFHPEYKKNGRFYIYYTAPFNQSGYDHKSILAEYRMSKENPDKASQEEKIIMEIPQPESNHNGGMLAFGPDGFLYIGTGDGGGAGDRHGKFGNAQDLSSLLGKILRIDVDTGSPYSIPADNPFWQKGQRPEIYAYGLRNPWRFSFDSKMGKLFCGDVGQNQWEEVDIIEKGKNYGWRIYEAEEVFDKDQSAENLVFPIHYYPRNIGISVIGGYVYRGGNNSYNGNYFFADWNGKFFSLIKKGDIWQSKLIHTGSYTINSLGEDYKGNIYILAQEQTGPQNASGILYRLELK